MSTYREMKILLAVSIMCLFLASHASTVVAANNQGLEWGVEQNDRFDYAVKATYHNATFDLSIDDEMYVIVNELPAIPDDVNNTAQIAFYEFTTYWDNGTAMDSFWYDIFLVIPFYILPIGNWSLMEELALETVPAVEVTQDEFYFTENVSVTDYNCTFVVDKSDGVLAYMNLDWIRTFMGDTLSIELIRAGYVLPTTTSVTTSTTTTSTASTTTTTTTSTTPVGDGTYLLLSGGIVAAVVIVGVVVLLARRR